jgi:hypothetical protein
MGDDAIVGNNGMKVITSLMNELHKLVITVCIGV